MASVAGQASSSSCTPSPTSRPWSWTYHVFLSFRGEDTRKGFLGHLFAALERKGITAFKDDRVLQKGDVIFDELLKAIDESMFAITVLSPNYATSAWCLDELQRIVERSNDQRLAIVPIFYDVEPSDVRYQKGSFEEAFRKQERRFGQDSDKVRKWRDALKTVAGCSGWNSKDKDEAELVENIAQDIHEKLIPRLPYVTEKRLIGILSKVEGVYSLLGMGLKDVRFIGIWGMGGVGKSTIVRTVYEAIQDNFEVSCFLANIREVHDKNNIVQVQQELVAQVNRSARTFYNEHDGRRIIQNSLCNKKVLLVIDDVHKASQLENLAGSQNWFGPGSRIIITTRDMGLLNRHGVYGFYEVEGLTLNESLQLFCHIAFKQDQPKKWYLDLSNEVVQYSGGLPLALEVLGSYLCERSLEVWFNVIKKIRSIPHKEILKSLKISYDDLDSMEKNIFLDIACFYKGNTRDYVTDILQKCGYNPKNGIHVLIERSLVTLSKKGELEMHNLIEEMGKNIVFQESPNDPGRRSRLWSKTDIDFVLTQNEGTKAIQGIVLPEFYKGRCSPEAFSNMSQLKLLKIRGVELPLSLNNHLPSSIKVLHWELYPLKTLPLADEQCEVVDIVLNDGKIEQLWQGKKFLKWLKNLDLSCCSQLKEMPDFSALPNLEKLKLHSCISLTEVHPSLRHHKNLVTLHLLGCGGIKTFPGKLEMSSLRELIIDGCDLENLPEFGECMNHLSRFSLNVKRLSQLPTSLGCLVGLEELILTGCNKLVCLPDTIHGLNSLKILNASRCKNLNRLPSSTSHLSLLTSLESLDLSSCRLTEKELFLLDSCHFPSLKELNLCNNLFVSIPMSIHNLPKLQLLRLDNCLNLQSLPELPSSMRELHAQGCDSLNKFEFNPLSKASRFFASPSQDHGQVLQMLITGKEIPSWFVFVHQEYGNCVSVPPLQHDLPQNERLGIAFCFLLQVPSDPYLAGVRSLAVHNGQRQIATVSLDVDKPGYNLHILCLSKDYFGNETQLENQFELSSYPPEEKVKIWSSAARWMHIANARY